MDAEHFRQQAAVDIARDAAPTRSGRRGGLVMCLLCLAYCTTWAVLSAATSRDALVFAATFVLSAPASLAVAALITRFADCRDYIKAGLLSGVLWFVAILIIVFGAWVAVALFSKGEGRFDGDVLGAMMLLLLAIGPSVILGFLTGVVLGVSSVFDVK
jgi:hypothetical protein